MSAEEIIQDCWRYNSPSAEAALLMQSKTPTKVKNSAAVAADISHAETQTSHLTQYGLIAYHD
jgi:hypothetical protein